MLRGPDSLPSGRQVATYLVEKAVTSEGRRFGRLASKPVEQGSSIGPLLSKICPGPLPAVMGASSLPVTTIATSAGSYTSSVAAPAVKVPTGTGTLSEWLG